jgi:hypothetical protein
LLLESRSPIDISTLTFGPPGIFAEHRDVQSRFDELRDLL